MSLALIFRNGIFLLCAGLLSSCGKTSTVEPKPHTPEAEKGQEELQLESPSKRQKNHFRKFKKMFKGWVPEGELGLGSANHCTDILHQPSNPEISLRTKGLHATMQRDGTLNMLEFTPEGLRAQREVTNIVSVLDQIHGGLPSHSILTGTHKIGGEDTVLQDFHELVEIRHGESNFVARCHSSFAGVMMREGKVYRYVKHSPVTKMSMQLEWPEHLPTDLRHPSWERAMKRFLQSLGVEAKAEVTLKEREICYSERDGQPQLLLTIGYQAKGLEGVEESLPNPYPLKMVAAFIEE